MSVWKKASKAHQKTHRERHQPEGRAHLGLLEKKKDYVRRAHDYNEKKSTLKVLRKRALNKNPDEFYHHMINAKIEDGRHFEKETEPEDTPDQLKVMRTQDLKYVITKRTQELKKIDKLQGELHFASVEHDVKNKHIRFDKKADKSKPEKPLLSVSNVDVKVLEQASKIKKQRYTELAKRVERERELAVIHDKIQLKRHLQDKTRQLKPKRIRKGNKEGAAVYLFKYERKK